MSPTRTTTIDVQMLQHAYMGFFLGILAGAASLILHLLHTTGRLDMNSSEQWVEYYGALDAFNSAEIGRRLTYSVIDAW